MTIPPDPRGCSQLCRRGTTEFWRLSQGKGWFFRFGEETPIVDAESVTLVKRHAAGKWVRS